MIPIGGFHVQGATCIGDSFVRTSLDSFHDPPPKTDAELKAEHDARMQQCIGRRIHFLEPPERTEYWRQNYIRMQGKVPWLPTYGMTGTVTGMPEWKMLGAGPTVRWDDGHVTTLGSVSQYEFIS